MTSEKKVSRTLELHTLLIKSESRILQLDTLDLLLHFGMLSPINKRTFTMARSKDLVFLHSIDSHPKSSQLQIVFARSLPERYPPEVNNLTLDIRDSTRDANWTDLEFTHVLIKRKDGVDYLIYEGWNRAVPLGVIKGYFIFLARMVEREKSYDIEPSIVFEIKKAFDTDFISQLAKIKKSKVAKIRANKVIFSQSPHHFSEISKNYIERYITLEIKPKWDFLENFQFTESLKRIYESKNTSSTDEPIWDSIQVTGLDQAGAKVVASSQIFRSRYYAQLDVDEKGICIKESAFSVLEEALEYLCQDALITKNHDKKNEDETNISVS